MIKYIFATIAILWFGTVMLFGAGVSYVTTSPEVAENAARFVNDIEQPSRERRELREARRTYGDDWGNDSLKDD
ncbi:hypothetical protein [Altererythrobacter sp. ZODW24]|uniref:hypothetical protein n=1 Tax=Altererythrobacter sp. ZODW24 TaxID=2185142 RepID=UPI0013B3D148|nr:hypothetical protein [Altererythrobacter sp. ZODW24]